MSETPLQGRGEAILADAQAAKDARDTDPLLDVSDAPGGPLTDPVPDHNRSADAPPVPPPPLRGRGGIRLGQNKKPRSGVRALTKSDHEKIVGLYITIGFGVMLIRQEAGKTIGEQAEQCADAWVELARENDSVRRALLFMIEGGAWGAVMVAHLPILFALLPDSFRESYAFLFPKVPDSPGPEGNGLAP